MVLCWPVAKPEKGKRAWDDRRVAWVGPISGAPCNMFLFKRDSQPLPIIMAKSRQQRNCTQTLTQSAIIVIMQEEEAQISSGISTENKKKKKLLSHWERGELEQTRFYFRQSCILPPLPLRIKTRWCSKTVVLLHGANAVHSKDNNHSGAKTKSSEKREEKLFKVLDYANRYLARGLLELNNVSED